MTTATDWKVHDPQTGEHPVVTDVTSAAPEHAMQLRAAHALAVRNAELSEQVRHLGDLVERLTEDNRVAQLELDRLHAMDDPRGGWVARRDVSAITGAADLTERQQLQALAAPPLEDLTGYDDDLGVVPNPIGGAVADRKTWPIWLGDVHHADRTLTESITDLRSWADSYAAPPVERTVVQPVRVDYSYRQTEAWALADLVRGQSQQDSVYAELAPERIQDEVAEPERERQPEGREGLDKMVKRVPTAISAPPKAAELEAEPDGWVADSWWARTLAWIGSRRKRGA